uniref:Pentacotripeptide-repeat region of PRORP domain-containing protein n=1 Tax=Araucaria cunninghamii TaxID=56994 RepID=A0A0D6R3J0_ARACU
MMIQFQLPFVYNSSSAISKRLYSYHPCLLSFSSFIFSSKQSYVPYSTALSTLLFPHFDLNSKPKSPILFLNSNAKKSLQSLRPYSNNIHLPYKTLMPIKSFTVQHRRNLIIQAGSDNAASDDDEEEEEKKKKELATKPRDPKQHKPLFDPFNKKPVIEEPEDPTNLQEIFHNMKEDNLVQQAVKMFDGLSKDGYTQEAMKLFGVLKDKAKMPDIVAHTAVVEAYCKAGKIKDGLKCFMRMQASGIKPNSYSYSVLIHGLCQAGMLEEAGKYMLDMLSNGWNPNAATYVTLVDSYLRAKKENEMQQLLVKLKGKGFVADDKAAREHMKKMGRFNRGVMDVLFGQFK